MAGHKYATKGYSTYTDIPSLYGDYDHGSNKPFNMYVVETTTIERIRTPIGGHTNFGGSPPNTVFLKEFVHSPSMLVVPKYTFDERREGYEPSYGSDYENSSPPRYYEREELVDNFFNKLQVDASRPMQTSNFSSPNRYRPSSPNKHQPSSPIHNYTSNKVRPIKMGNLSSPNKYDSSSPNKHQPSSPIHNYTSNGVSPIEMDNFSSPKKYDPSNPNKYKPSSPNKHRPTSPIHNFASNGVLPMKIGNFSSQNKYRPSSPDKYSSSSPDKYRPSIPNNYRSVIPNKYRSSSPDPKEERHVRTENLTGPNNNWHNAGQSTTRHALTTPTNDINEALSFLEVSVNYSPHSGPNRREGVLNDFSSHARPTEHERRYAKPIFGGVPTESRYNPKYSGNTIDSKEAMRKYGGTFVL